jgi:hypothetical protein
MLYQVIRPVYLLAFFASCEGIGKTAQMARSLKDALHPDGWSLDLCKPFGNYEVLPPDVFNAPLEGCSQRAVIIKSRGSAIELESGPEKATPAGKLIYQLIPVHFPILGMVSEYRR